MPIEERWVQNGSVRLHGLAQETDSALTPFLIVPGTFGVAEDYIQEMEALAPRRCLTVSLRGRGRSDAPPSGYRFEDHVADIVAAAAQLGDERFAMMGYSMGAAYALGFAAQQSRRIAGVIVGDYPARYRALSPKWAERAVTAMPERARPEVAEALQRESSEVLLWDSLGSIDCPVMILKGGQPGSMVTGEIAAKYLERLNQGEIVTLDRNAHELWRPDFESYIGAIRAFLKRVDHAQI
jgi:pimeloyl-ACP methyl ester carboxylesterase